jgi:hypothetical protein
MACLKGSAAGTGPKLLQRCSPFYRAIALIDEFLRLSPYGSLIFAAPAPAPGLSRMRER